MRGVRSVAAAAVGFAFLVRVAFFLAMVLVDFDMVASPWITRAATIASPATDPSPTSCAGKGCLGDAFVFIAASPASLRGLSEMRSLQTLWPTFSTSPYC